MIRDKQSRRFKGIKRKTKENTVSVAAMYVYIFGIILRNDSPPYTKNECAFLLCDYYDYRLYQAHHVTWTVTILDQINNFLIEHDSIQCIRLQEQLPEVCMYVSTYVRMYPYVSQYIMCTVCMYAWMRFSRAMSTASGRLWRSHRSWPLPSKSKFRRPGLVLDRDRRDGNCVWL